MGVFGEKRGGGGEEGGGGGQSLDLDLDRRLCEECRRELHPWQDVCPDDGGRGVDPSDLAPAPDPLADRLASLLEEEGQSEEPDER